MEHSPIDREVVNQIWISHHPMDDDRVLPIAQQMQRDGVDVQWNRQRSAFSAPCASDGQKFYLIFLSVAYLADEGCRKELDRIRMGESLYLPIYLEEVALPQSLAMRIGRTRALFLDRYNSLEALCNKIYEAQKYGLLAEDAGSSLAGDIFCKQQRKRTGTKVVGGLLAAVLVVGILLTAVSGMLPSFFGGARISAENQTEEMNLDVEESEADQQSEQAILNTAEYQVVVKKYQYVESIGVWELELLLVNDTAEAVTFTTKEESINGFVVKTEHSMYNGPAGEYAWAEQVPAYQTRLCRVEYPALLWREAGAEDVLRHTGILQIRGASDEELVSQPFEIYPAGEAAAQGFAPKEIPKGSILYESDMLCAAYLGVRQYGEMRERADLFYLCNKSDVKKRITFTANLSRSEEDGFVLMIWLSPGTQVLVPAYWVDVDDKDAEAKLEILAIGATIEDREDTEEISVALER